MYHQQTCSRKGKPEPIFRRALMQTTPNQNRPDDEPSGHSIQGEILAILAESGLVPGQGVEAMLERFSDESQTS
jgi:hypothetical protein